MRSIVVYESMFGNTHTVAERIADGLRTTGGDAAAYAAADVTREMVAEADLVVVGGPTHAHGMSSSASRKGAIDQAAEDPDLALDPDAEGPGLRDWFKELGRVDGIAAAAFDTRFDASPVLTGRASKGILRRLRHDGFRPVVEPMSFFVDKSNHLLDGEAARARVWGEHLLAVAAPTRL